MQLGRERFVCRGKRTHRKCITWKAHLLEVLLAELDSVLLAVHVALLLVFRVVSLGVVVIELGDMLVVELVFRVVSLGVVVVELGGMLVVELGIVSNVLALLLVRRRRIVVLGHALELIVVNILLDAPPLPWPTRITLSARVGKFTARQYSLYVTL